MTNQIDGEELDAAKDYWSQIFSRLAADPMATLVERDKFFAELSAVDFDALSASYGIPDEERAAFKAQYIEQLQIVPETSPGVDPHAEYLLGALCKRVEEACRLIPGVDVSKVAKGVEPRLGVFASRMGVIMTDASVVTVGSQIFRFCSTVSKAAALTVQIDPAAWDHLDNLEAIRCCLRANPEVLAYWTRVFVSFALYGTSTTLVPLILVPTTSMGLRGEMLEALEIFVVAHEYSHHILKHGRIQLASSESGKDASARKEELEADTLAILIGQLVTGHKEHENTLMIAGVGMVVFLHALHMLDETRRLLRSDLHGVAAHGTHPSLHDRLESIDQAAFLWPTHERELRHLRRSYGNMMQRVWEEIRPAVEKIGTAGPPEL